MRTKSAAMFSNALGLIPFVSRVSKCGSQEIPAFSRILMCLTLIAKSLVRC